MKNLKHIRVAVSLVMLFESVMWVLWLPASPVHSQVSRALQISPSVVYAGVGATLGAGLLWLLATLLFGRVYCSSMCPVGTLQDMAIRAGRLLHVPRLHHTGYRCGSHIRFAFLGIYVAGMVAAIGIVPLLLEPWAAFVNALTALSGKDPSPALASLGVGAGLGLVCALVSVLAVALYTMLCGRDFCNEVCPVGTVLRKVSECAVMHIELDPDACDSCLKCEDVCKASCIDIKTRTIDNARCVRCFNCIAACPRRALRFTPDRNGVITGLFIRRRQTSAR